MSFFRLLQNSPSTISIFHNARVPASARIYASLEKAYFTLNEDKNQFQIDTMAKQMPTYDQFRTIYSQCVHSDESKNVLKTVYPFLDDKVTRSKDSCVTFKALGMNTNRGFRVFSENEYNNIHEAFTELVAEKDPEIDPAQIFRAPLLVDWDQNMIACDEEGLQQMLAKYRPAEDHELSPA